MDPLTLDLESDTAPVSGGGPAPATGEEQPIIDRTDPVDADPFPSYDFTNVKPADPVTTAEEAEYQRNAEVPTLWEGTKAAVQSEWSLYWGLGFNENMMPNPDYVIDEAEHKRLTDGIPEDYWGYFDQAHSTEHGTVLRQKLLKDMEVEKKLGDMGWTGTGLRIAAAIADPVAIGATIVTEGALGPMMYGAKLSRLSRAMRIGAGSAVTDMGIETALINQKPTGEAMDVLYAGLGSFALGSAVGAITKGVNPDANQAIADAMTRAQMSIESGEIQLLDSAGAMRAYSHFEPISEEAEDALKAAEKAPYTAFGNVRIDSMGQTKNSPHALVRGSSLAEDAVGNKDNSVNIFGATERQDHIWRAADTTFHRETGSAFRRWADENKLGWFGRQKARKSFMEEVTLAIRDDVAQVSKQAREAADAVRKQYADLLRQAKKAGVRGFENIEENINYVNRIYDPVKMKKLRDRYTDPEVRRLIKEAIMETQQEMSEELAEKYAKWHWKKIRGHAVGHDMTMGRALAGEDLDSLREILLEEVDWTEADADALISLFKNKEVGNHSRTKHRLMFDEKYSTHLRTPDGELERVSISDLLENDVERLFSIYNRQVSGAIALARSGFDSRKAFEKHLKQIRETADQVPNYTQNDLARDIENLEFQYSAVTGSPYAKNASGQDLRNTKWGRAMAMVRDYNFLRVMNQVGWAQLAEIGNTIGEVGITTAFKSLPGFRAMIRDARTGKLADEFSDELESIFGIGADRMRGIVGNRWDDFGNYLNTNEGGVLAKADTLLKHGKRITADISGMAGINTVLHRWVVRSYAQKFADQAFKLTKTNVNRLKAAGLSEGMINRIHEQIRKHGKLVDGVMSRKKIRGLNLEKWDVDVAEDFKMAVHRLARKTVQENDAGNMHRFMSTPVGQVVMQFRSFMTVAYAKQTLRGIHHRDWETFASWSLSMVAAGMAYTAQTYLKSLGRDDADKYRKENLSFDRIGFAAFQRSGWSSLFPAAVITGGDMVSDDPFWDSTAFRSTGLSSSGFFGNPTFDLGDKAIKAAVSTGKLATQRDFKFSQANVRDYAGILPFQNAMLIQNIQNMLSADLPKRSE